MRRLYTAVMALSLALALPMSGLALGGGEHTKRRKAATSRRVGAHRRVVGGSVVVTPRGAIGAGGAGTYIKGGPRAKRRRLRRE